MLKLVVQIFPLVCVVCRLLESEIDGQSEVFVAAVSEFPMGSLKEDICMFRQGALYIWKHGNGCKWKPC